MGVGPNLEKVSIIRTTHLHINCFRSLLGPVIIFEKNDREVCSQNLLNDIILILQVAVKFEKESSRCPQLRHEYKVYRELVNCHGFCCVSPLSPLFNLTR